MTVLMIFLLSFVFCFGVLACVAGLFAVISALIEWTQHMNDLLGIALFGLGISLFLSSWAAGTVIVLKFIKGLFQ